MSLLSHVRFRAAPKLAWFGCGALLLVTVPQFLCLPLECDAIYFDAQARCVLDGGVLYRDLIEPNFPGVVWLHLLIRAIGGWSMVALRIFDLLVLAGIVVLLSRIQSRRVRFSEFDAASKYTLPWLASAVAWFYLSLSPWNHCQRDLWMLLPALVAVVLRVKCLDRPVGSTRSTTANLFWSRPFHFGVAEGLAWSAAFWIKPHIAVPAVAVWTTSVWASRNARLHVANLLGVLLGGLTSGAVGSAWLIQSGAWPSFWCQQLDWNLEYVASRDMSRIANYLGSLFLGFGPWSWAHVVATPLAIRALFLPCAEADEPIGQVGGRLLSALYLGWIVQSVALQFAFAYVHVPGVVLALAIVAQQRWPAEWRAVPRAFAAAMLLAAWFISPAMHWSRLKHLPTCVTQGPSLELRRHLLPKPDHFWTDYEAIVKFLRDRRVKDREVLVAHSSLMVLYHDLELRLPTRFALPDVHAVVFASHRAEMLREIEQLSTRFIVSDMLGTGLSLDDVRDDDPATKLPRKLSAARRGEFPFDRPVLYRAGWFTVHGERG